MRKSTKALLVGAVAGLGLVGYASQANAAPIVDVRLVLEQATPDSGSPSDPTLDTNSHVPVPQVGGVYQLAPGQRFYVSVGFAIETGTENRTGTQTTRSSATRDKPLGLGAFNLNILSPSNGLVKPINNSGTTASGGQWNFGADQGSGAGQGADLTTDGYGSNLANVADQNADGVPDVAGSGFADTNSIVGVSTATSLARMEYGDDISSGTVGTNHGTPALYQQGEFQVVNDAAGTGNLLTQWLASNQYSDPGTNNNLASSALPSANVNMANVALAVPEPASLGLLGLLGLALGRKRRK